MSPTSTRTLGAVVCARSMNERAVLFLAIPDHIRLAEIKVGPVPTVSGLVIVGGPPHILVTTGVLAMDDLDAEPLTSVVEDAIAKTEPDRNPVG